MKKQILCVMSCLMANTAWAIDDISELPTKVAQDIEYARELCRAMGKPYRYKTEYIAQADINGDGRMDYIVDGRGHDCAQLTERMYRTPSGHSLYMYLATADGGWDKIYDSYVYEYRVKPVFGQAVPFIDVWARGDAGYQANHLRYKWNGKELEIIEREMGVEVPTQLWKNFD